MKYKGRKKNAILIDKNEKKKKKKRKKGQSLLG